MASPGACEIVKSWLRSNAERLGLKEVQFKHSDDIGKFGAGYEFRGHLIGVAAWDNASCFDIDVIDTRTRKAQILFWGPCAGDAELLGRLQVFEAWLATLPGI